MIEKRGRGRPPAGDLKKTKMMCFWVNEETYRQILKACEMQNDMKQAQFCEEAVLKKLRRVLKE